MPASRDTRGATARLIFMVSFGCCYSVGWRSSVRDSLASEATMRGSGRVVPQQVVVIRAQRLIERFRVFLRARSTGVACDSRRVVCCVEPAGISGSLKFSSVLFVLFSGAVFVCDVCTEAFAGIMDNITPIIAMAANAKNNPVNLMECLTIKGASRVKRVSTFCPRQAS